MNTKTKKKKHREEISIDLDDNFENNFINMIQSTST